MNHAAARELLESLYALPAEAPLLDARTRSALDEHVAECAECSAEQRVLAATATALQVAYGPPPALRERVLGSVERAGRQRTPVSSQAGVAKGRLIAFPRALAAAAVLAVLAFVGGALTMTYLAPRADDRALAKAAMMMADMARDPAAQAMTLQDPSGAPGGTVMYQPETSMLVVFSESLEKPASGSYGCYLERAGERTWIGPMLFEADTAFWAGPLRTAVPPQPGDRFLVLAAPDDATPMLVTSF